MTGTSIQHRAGADVASAVDEIDDKKEKGPSQDVSRWIYVAFCAETCASVMLTATFNTFHVETFLTEYKLDLSSYATGHVIYAAINTLNDIVGAALLDSLALTKGRAWLLQCGGLLWSLSFLLPWFPWPSYPALHFVFSLSCYDTMYSFCAIAGGSLLTEMDISDSQRIHVLRIKAIFGMATGFLVTSLGQLWFPHKASFRLFCIGLAVVSGLGFAVFYYAIRRASPRRPMHRSAPSSPVDGPVSLRGVLGEFWRLSNFHAWLGMEMCLETQSNFNRSYLRLFVTTFVPDPSTAALFVSALPVAKQLVKVAAFSALDRLGVYEVYRLSFRVKFAAAVALVVLSGGSGASSPPWLILTYIAVNAIVTDIPTGGFTVAMSNMHKEMVLRRLQSRRDGGKASSEPTSTALAFSSSSGMFMGLNAVFCKPMDSLLPILAAKWLQLAAPDIADPTAATRAAMFHLVVGPPLVLCAIQMWSWSRYTLTRQAMHAIEAEYSLAIQGPKPMSP